MVLFGKAQSASKLFNKAIGSTKKFFNKDVKNVVNKVASGAGSVGKVLNDVSNVGNKIIGSIDNSAFGGALAPLTGVAKGVLGSVSALGSAANVGKHMLKDTTSGKSADKIVGSVLEKAKKIENTVSPISFH